MDPDAKLYARAKAFTDRYSGGLRKHIFLVFGAMLYIAFIVMALFFYRPSYVACMVQSGGTMWGVVNASVNGVFFSLFIFFTAQGFLPTDFMRSFRDALPSILFVCMIFLIISHGLLFFQCQDPVRCSDCTAAERIRFNTLVTRQVDYSSKLTQLYNYYNAQMTKDRTPLSRCSNYYDSAYRTAVGNTCTAASADSVCNINLDPTVGAPVLAEFFVMTSGRTCVIGPQCDGYMSTRMITIALTAGARCLDFDVSARGYSRDPLPIVTVSRDRDNYNLQRNFVTLEDCLRTVVSKWYGDHIISTNGDSTSKRDPLFLHLNLRASLTAASMDAIGRLVLKYGNQYNGAHLLPQEFNYAATNMGTIPICMLFEKLIIIVHSPFRPTTNTLIDGLINIHTGLGVARTSVFAQHKPWSTVKNEKDVQAAALTDFNRTSLTYVETSFHPYRPISSSLKTGEGGASDDLTSVYTTSDSLTTLMINKQTINNSPSVPLRVGCQFVAMNLQTSDGDLQTYLGFFQKASLVLKPKALRRPLPTYTSDIYPFNSCSAPDAEVRHLIHSDTECREICLGEKSMNTFCATNDCLESAGKWQTGYCDKGTYTIEAGPTMVGDSHSVKGGVFKTGVGTV